MGHCRLNVQGLGIVPVVSSLLFVNLIVGPQVYRVFRGLGLRHLLVLDSERHISGVIARQVLFDGHMYKLIAWV